MLDHLSISSLQLHRKNPRRWCLEYIEKLREPPSVAIEFGTLIHEGCEDLVNYGEFKQSLASLSQPNRDVIYKWFEDNRSELYPNKGWRVEDEFRIWLDPTIPPLVGRIDLWRVEDYISDWAQKEYYVHVIDHKTATQGYGESEFSLSKNWQLLLYCHVLDPSLSVRGSLWPDESFRMGAKISHTQFYKKKEKLVAGQLPTLQYHRVIKTEVSGKQVAAGMAEIKHEAILATRTIEEYNKKGMQAIRETPENEKWYGRKCIFWPIISGQMSIADFRKENPDIMDKD